MRPSNNLASRALLDHLCKPRVWGDNVSLELPPANRLARTFTC